MAANSLCLSSSFGGRKVENQKHLMPIISFLTLPQQLGGHKWNAVFSLQNQWENIRFGRGGGTAKGASEHLEGGVDTFSTIAPSNNTFPINFLVALIGTLVILPKTSKREASKLRLSL